MPLLANNPAFLAYAVTLLVLTLNLLGLWFYSGAVRGRSKTTPNPEDARSSARRVVDGDPPEVARVLRAHKNASAAIVPFAILGLVYVLAGAPAGAAIVVFGAFAVARVAHSLTYLAGKQPWRSVSFGAGALATVVLMGLIVRTLVQARLVS